ncbi:MAG: DUF2057 domain-containing protein [Gammaproteobacteria bacterium]|nr:DUF2057 domain-containing protein [Gammaproteobacteria bacterium]
MRRPLPSLLLAHLLAFVAIEAHAARLELPEEVIVQAVNGQDLGLQLFGTKDYLELAPGSHRIAVKYKDLFEMMGDNHEVVASDPVLLAFELPTEGTYRLSFTKPTELTQARAFAKAPKFLIVDAKGTPLAQQSLTQEERDSLWQATLGGGSITSGAAKMTAAPQASAVAATPTAAAVAPAAAVTPAAAVAAPSIAAPSVSGATTDGAQRMTAEQLNYWWSQADSETRAAFLNAISAGR